MSRTGTGEFGRPKLPLLIWMTIYMGRTTGIEGLDLGA